MHFVCFENDTSNFLGFYNMNTYLLIIIIKILVHRVEQNNCYQNPHSEMFFLCLLNITIKSL